jgi:hypothetical protein
VGGAPRGASLSGAGWGWLGYLINGFGLFLSPAFAAHHLSLAFLTPGIVAEGSLCLWLIVVGVNAVRWRRQAGAAVG